MVYSVLYMVHSFHGLEETGRKKIREVMYFGTLERLEKKDKKSETHIFTIFILPDLKKRGQKQKLINHVLLKLIVVLNELLKLIQ